MEDFSKLFSQVQAAQGKVQKIQQEIQQRLANITVKAESGAGAVQATASGNGYLRSIDISPEFINAQEKETMQDLVVAAANLAIKRAKEREQEEMQHSAEGMLSGLPFNFGG